MHEGLVSVLLLSMNHSKYVMQSCTSILNQTYRNIEILYVDNNSMDNSFEIADELFRESGVSYKGHKRTENYGISVNVNFLLNEAKGEFIAFLSADDWWANDHLQLKVDLFSKNQVYGLVYGNGYIFKENDQSQSIFYTKPQRSGWVFRELLQGNFMHAVSVVIRSDVLKKVGIFDENSPIEDWEMWLRISEKFQVGYSDVPATFYRVTHNNLSANLEFMNNGFEYIFKKYKAHSEIRTARRNIRLGQAYYLASSFPGTKSLLFILKNFQLNSDYLKHVTRCILGMAGYKIKPRVDRSTRIIH